MDNPASRLNFRQLSDKLLRHLEASDFSGWDPFDALNSKLFNATPLAQSATARLVWTQLFKRAPINLRPLVGIAPRTNPVTIALAADIYRRDGEIDKAQACINRLISMTSNGKEAGSTAWGYPFAWQAKAFYVPNGAANVIATAYAVRELVHWKEQMGEPVEQLIAGAANYVALHLMRGSSVGGRYLAYVENSDAMVHNANLWGAYVLAEGWKVTGRHAWLALARSSVTHTLRAQSDDGSWPYGEARHHQFTDGFHTGYVLEALHRIETIDRSIEARSGIERGLDYYLSKLLETDGTARYYSTNRYPIDGNCAAQCIIVLDTLGFLQKHADLAEKVMQTIIATLWLEKREAFAYQRTPRFLNRIDYPRWTQIWLALALRIAAKSLASSTTEEAPQRKQS